MITEFESKDAELEYYRNYVRKILRERAKEIDETDNAEHIYTKRYYSWLWQINDILQEIEDKRDFYELKALAYSYTTRLDKFVDSAWYWFKRKRA